MLEKIGIENLRNLIDDTLKDYAEHDKKIKALLQKKKHLERHIQQDLQIILEAVERFFK